MEAEDINALFTLCGDEEKEEAEARGRESYQCFSFCSRESPQSRVAGDERRLVKQVLGTRRGRYPCVPPHHLWQAHL